MSKLTKKNNISKSELVTKEEVLESLRKELRIVMNCFWDTIGETKNHLSVDPKHHAKNFTVSTIATYFSKNLDACFPNCSGMRPHKQFVFSLNGYDFWVKKADSSNRPMLNDTKLSNSLISLETMPFFEGFYECIMQQNASKALLFMTYQIGELGEVFNPCISFINEGFIMWTINEDDLAVEKYKTITLVEANKQDFEVKLKTKVERRKAQNE